MSSLTFGILTIKSTQLLFLICLLAALAIALVVSQRRKITVADTTLQIALLSLIVARLVFVATWFNLYWKAPLSMLDIRDGGFNVTAGIATACALVMWRGWRQPALRTPLAAGMLTFLLAWGFATPSAESFAGEVALPTSTIKTFDGKMTTLRELAHGKPLLVNFWASWCPPCRREMPLLVAAQKQHKDIAFAFMNEDSDPADARAFAGQMKIPADRTVADTGYAVMQGFHAQGLPTTLYFSADGQLVSMHVGELSEAMLASSLQKLKK